LHDKRTPRGKLSPFQTSALKHALSPLLGMLWDGHNDVTVTVQMDLVLGLDHDRREVLRDDGRASQMYSRRERYVVIDRTLHETVCSRKVHRACHREGHRGLRGSWQGL